MARKFDPTDIQTPVKARLRGDSFTHLNNAFDELTNAIVKGLLSSYTTNDVIILNGCVVSGTVVAPGPAAITAGQVFYNGRIYEVDAVATLNLTGAQVPVFTIVESLQGGQTTFSDANDYDFQVIEKVAMTAGLSGSGIKNVSDAKFLKKSKRLQMGSWDMDTAGTIDVSHGLSLVQYRKMTVVGITILVDDLNSSYPLPLAPVTGGVETGDGVVYFDTSVIRITRLATGFLIQVRLTIHPLIEAT